MSALMIAMLHLLTTTFSSPCHFRVRLTEAPGEVVIVEGQRVCD